MTGLLTCIRTPRRETLADQRECTMGMPRPCVILAASPRNSIDVLTSRSRPRRPVLEEARLKQRQWL